MSSLLYFYWTLFLAYFVFIRGLLYGLNKPR